MMEKGDGTLTVSSTKLTRRGKGNADDTGVGEQRIYHCFDTPLVLIFPGHRQEYVESAQDEAVHRVLKEHVTV
jgi:hypothetical protein